MINKLKIGVITLSLASIGTISHASIVGDQSTSNGETYVLVGTSIVPFGPHTAGHAGIGVSKYYYGAKFGKVDFQGLVKSKYVHTYETNGATVYNNAGGNGDQKHKDIGTYNFIRVGDGDVWFGSWSADNNAVQNQNWKNRQVYYVGDDTGTTIPTSGSATYTVHGLNHFNGSNVLHGEFSANFGTQKLTGSIQNDNLMIDMFSVGFNNAGEISGIAYARNPQTHKFLARTVSNSDKVKGLTGHFFGANAASLAGFAQFDDQHRNYDTAFGGTKK